MKKHTELPDTIKLNEAFKPDELCLIMCLRELYKVVRRGNDHCHNCSCDRCVVLSAIECFPIGQLADIYERCCRLLGHYYRYRKGRKPQKTAR